MKVFQTILSGGGGLSASEVSIIAQAFDAGQGAKLLAADGQIGKTTSIVQFDPDATQDPNVFVTSCANGNMIYVNGVYVATRNIGENYEYQGSVGDIITSAKGHSGSTLIIESASNNAATILPFNYEALADRQFFFYVFREYDPFRVFVSTGAIATDVELKSGDGINVLDSARLGAFETAELSYDAAGAGEYQIVAAQPVFVSTAGDIGSNFDWKFVAPLVTKIIGHIRNCRVSALYNNTQVTCYSRMGNVHGPFSVSPGSPYSLGAAMPAENGKRHYDPDGYGVLVSSGPISALSGADGTGGEITSWVDSAMLSTVVGIPMRIVRAATMHNANLSIASLYAGKIKVYDRDLGLIGNYNLTRTGTDQRRPCGYRLSPTSGDDMKLGGGGYVVADVPIYVVANYRLASWGNSGEETVLFGIRDFQPEIIKDADGDYRLRRVDGSGVASWNLL